MARAVCATQHWHLQQARVYTGIPEAADKPFWNHFWIAKLAQMGREGIHVYSRPLRYRNESITLRDGTIHTALVGQEKGVDVRLALDIVSMAWRRDFDVALVFSQDQDLSEVADEIRAIGREQDRWMKIACAFPFSPACSNRRGINGTDWIRLDRLVYDSCVDPRDYRPKRP
ncbi:MAG: NYN domain-containing protein [Methylacidiphilales bacterium]|nr:NYN domain-containing protein [Candidatus Methylacidiphilales bacterium]